MSSKNIHKIVKVKHERNKYKHTEKEATELFHMVTIRQNLWLAQNLTGWKCVFRSICWLSHKLPIWINHFKCFCGFHVYLRKDLIKKGIPVKHRREYKNCLWCGDRVFSPNEKKRIKEAKRMYKELENEKRNYD